MSDAAAVADPGLDELAAVAERLRRSTVQVRVVGPHQSGGSGVVWRAGLVVTNAHVVTDRALEVEWPTGERRPARLAAVDRRRDLAALRVDTGDLVPVATASTRSLRIGALALAVGNPMGLSGAVSTGVIHSLASGRRGNSLVLADLRLLPGNSGGPLADAQGRVVGLNAMVLDGLAAAIPSEVVERFVAGAALAA